LRSRPFGRIVHLKVNNTAHLDRSFLAFSHPVRRTILERLAEGPASVGEATRGIAVSKPAVTKHLKLLEEAGAISRTVEGRTHTLRLEPVALDEASSWIDRSRELWERKFATIDRFLADNDE
jgi:DNA-binding transcriptional ArsR family regulator